MMQTIERHNTENREAIKKKSSFYLQDTIINVIRCFSVIAVLTIINLDNKQ